MRAFLEQVFGKKDVTSPKMRAALREWLALYYGEPFAGEDAANRVPVMIVSKLCRTVFAEYKSRLWADRGTPDWQQENLNHLDRVRRIAMQNALVGGECLLKPVPMGQNFDFVPIRRECFIPMGRDAHGNLLTVGTMERMSENGRQYALLERRMASPEGLTIENRLHEMKGQMLGAEVPLNALAQTAALQPELFLPGVKGVGLVCLRTPLLNCVDGSAEAVSIFAPAVGLLHSLARCEEQLEREMRNGASRVFASEDLLRPDSHGQMNLRDDLFVGLADDPANVGLTVYSPELREGSYLARKQDILRGCENLMGLRRGMLCEADTSERTATEVRATNADYDLTIRALQECWERTLREALTLCAALGRVYRLYDGEACTVTADWGDGVLYDHAATWQEYLNMVEAGLLRPEIAVAKYFGLPCETEGDRAKIRTGWMPASGKGGE